MLTQYFGRELPRSQTWRALSGGSFSYGLALVWTTTPFRDLRVTALIDAPGSRCC